MEAALKSLMLQGRPPRESWWLSVTPPTMASFIEILIEYMPCARSFVTWPAQLCHYN